MTIYVKGLKRLKSTIHYFLLWWFSNSEIEEIILYVGLYSNQTVYELFWFLSNIKFMLHISIYKLVHYVSNLFVDKKTKWTRRFNWNNIFTKLVSFLHPFGIITFNLVCCSWFLFSFNEASLCIKTKNEKKNYSLSSKTSNRTWTK